MVGTFEAFRRSVRYTLYQNTTIWGAESFSAGYRGSETKAFVQRHWGGVRGAASDPCAYSRALGGSPAKTRAQPLTQTRCLALIVDKTILNIN